MPMTNSKQMTIFDMLLHCAIRMNLTRIAAENAGRKYDRNDVVYTYFRKFSGVINPETNAETRGVVRNILKSKKTAGYVFDQYFQLWLGCTPSPDATPLGQVIREGLEKYGYATAV